MSALTPKLRRVSARGRAHALAALAAGRSWTRPVLDRARPVWAVVTPAGRAVLVVVLVAWFLAARFDWLEFAVIAAAGAFLLALAALFLIGRLLLTVDLEVEPPRVTVGEAVSGGIRATSLAKAPLLPFRLEVPVGQGGVAFDVPALKPGGTFDEIFVVPTHRRGVIEVGPVTSVRGDVLGLLRREFEWAAAREVFVHPRTVPLEPLGAGIVRDLEGRTSETLSMSDLAFHALREYEPGDDLRHVHWRSTARHGTMLVRQFLDTRRSHLNVIVDSRAEAYRSEDDYEVAVSAAASLLMRAILDEYDATFLSGPHAMTRGTGKAALDACSRAEPGTDSLVGVAVRGNRLAPDTSVLFLVTGPNTDFLTLQRAAAQFPLEATKVALRVDSEAQASLRSAGDLPLLTLGKLEELPGLLRWGL